MKQVEIRALLEPHLKARLHALTKGRDLGNGTPLADAAAVVAAIDLTKTGSRTAKDPAGSVAAMTDGQLLSVAEDVAAIVGETGNDKTLLRTLPHGTEMAPGFRSGVAISRTMFVPMRGVPGLHVPEDRGAMRAGEGSRLLREAIVKRLSKLPAMDVPVPSVDDVTITLDQYYSEMISVPLRSGPGTTYRHSRRIEAAETLLDAEIDGIAAEVAEMARDVWKQRERIDASGAEVAELVEPILVAARREGLPLALLGMKLDDSRLRYGGGYGETIPVFSMLGNDLKREEWSAFDWKRDTLPDQLGKQIGVLRRRKRILDEMSANGLRGRIERVTLAAIRNLAPDPTETLRRIARERRVTIKTGRGGRKTDPLRLTWKDGRVQSTFLFNKDVSWKQGSLIVNKTQFPQAVLDTLPGKPISALIEHPFLQPQDVIRSVRTGQYGDARWMVFNVDASWTTFDAETGEVAA